MKTWFLLKVRILEVSGVKSTIKYKNLEKYRLSFGC